MSVLRCRLLATYGEQRTDTNCCRCIIAQATWGTVREDCCNMVQSSCFYVNRFICSFNAFGKFLQLEASALLIVLSSSSEVWLIITCIQTNTPLWQLICSLSVLKCLFIIIIIIIIIKHKSENNKNLAYGTHEVDVLLTFQCSCSYDAVFPSAVTWCGSKHRIDADLVFFVVCE